MTWGPRARKALLTAHVTASVGWLGAVAASLALALAGLVSDDETTVRGVAATLEVLALTVLVPLSVASLVSGVLQGLGSRWGLWQHYWVTTKLVINVVASVVLLLYLRTLGDLADEAAAFPAGGDLDALRSGSPVLHAGVALGLLVAAVVLSIYKPAGRTRHGWRRAGRDRPTDAA